MRLGCCCKAPCHFFQTCWSSRLYFVWECHLWMNATWPGGSEETAEGCHSCHWRQWWGVIFRTDPQKISHELGEISGEKYLRIRFLWERVLGFFVFLTRSTGDWNYWKYESMPLRGGPQRAPEPCKHIIGAYQSNWTQWQWSPGLIESEFLLDLTMGNKPFIAIKYNFVLSLQEIQCYPRLTALFLILWENHNYTLCPVYLETLSRLMSQHWRWILSRFLM